MTTLITPGKSTGINHAKTSLISKFLKKSREIFQLLFVLANQAIVLSELIHNTFRERVVLTESHLAGTIYPPTLTSPYLASD